jgi:transcriptional regulator with XRE-family HTH domain
VDVNIQEWGTFPQMHLTELSNTKLGLNNNEGIRVTTFNNVWNKLSNREYRSAFAASQFKRLVPFQIRTLRKHRHWTQEQLAEYSKVTQGVVSRAEDSDNGNLTVNTILRIADGFDVAFVGLFVPYSELDSWFTNLSEDKIRVPSFDEENALFRFGRLGVQRNPRIRRRNRFTQSKHAAKRAVICIDSKKEFSPSASQGAQLQLFPDSSQSSKGMTRPYVGNIPRANNPVLSSLLANLPPKMQAGGFR